jgi:hypothetical protein
LRANDKPLIRNLDLLVEHGGAGSQTTAVKLTADALGGRINGKASFWRHNGRQTVYDGTIATKRLNLAGLSDVSAERRICGTGLLTGSLAFHGRGAALEDLQGRGEFLLQDIDAHSDPLTRAVFAFLNSTGGRTVTATDVKATFLIGRGVVTIQQAVLGSPLYVMRAEEGGTIDLRSGQLDVYLVTLDVAGAESLLETVPVVGMVTRFSDKLTRLHVTGMWNDQKFTKEPVKDISRAALELFQEMIVTGGRLPLQMPGPFTGLLRPFQARWLQKQTPASQPTGQRQFDPRGLGTNGR